MKGTWCSSFGIAVLTIAALTVTDAGLALARAANGPSAMAAGSGSEARLEVQLKGLGADEGWWNRVVTQIDESDRRELLTSPSWSAEGNQEGAEFGSQCATAGDVNGDGFSDVIVGAPYFANGQAGEGRAFVYYGSALGLGDSPAWTAESDQAEAHFGNSVATAGDVNGDGFSDVLVSAVHYDNGQTDEGRVYLFLGSASGLGASPAWIVEGNHASDQFGLSLGTAGDVNGDGFSDVIIGATGFVNGRSGRATVYHGSAAGLNSTPDWVMTSVGISDGIFGWSVSTAGDVNADGFADVIIGVAAYDGPSGAAYVFHGSPGGLFMQPAWSVVSPQTIANYGHCVAAAGDVNGDGYSDIMVGAEQYDSPETDEGRVYVYNGSEGGLSTTPSWFVDGEQTDAQFGYCVATAGDVNADGYADILIGALRYDNGETDEGRAYVYLGSRSGLADPPVSTIEGNQAFALLGTSAATAGDVNGDGFSDFLVGVLGYGNGQAWEGRAMGFYGGSRGVSTSAAWSGEPHQVGANFGNAVASSGDVNGDGYSDIIVAGFRIDDGQVDEGRAFDYRGGYMGLTTSPIWATESNQTNALLGWHTGVASAGDVNGDGYSDVIVGAPLFDNGQVDEGRAWVYFGSGAGILGTPAWTAEPNQAGAVFGISVASAGDVNGDGYSDVIVGADPAFIGGNGLGRAYAYYGSPSGLAPSPSWSVQSDQIGSGFGAVIASAGDVNGDGFSDVLVSAPTHDHGSTDEGRVFVYLGSAGGLASTPAWTAESDQAFAQFGFSAAGAGDVNGDGFSDVIISADQFDNGHDQEGRAFVYCGSAIGLAAAPAWTMESNLTGGGFQMSVATAGDVNSDGFSDVIVGLPQYDGDLVDEGRAMVFLGSVSGLAAEASWMVESDQLGANLGFSVAPAGDVNGDTLSDVIVSAINYDFGETNEGRALVYYGNQRGGLERVPTQARIDDSAPIGLLGHSDSEMGFRLKALARTPAGRGRIRLQYEVKPLGALFDGSGLSSGPAIDTGEPTGSGSAVLLSEVVGNLHPGALYHWRARFVTDSPLFPRSPWFTHPGNAVTEGDLRTNGWLSSAEEITTEETTTEGTTTEESATNPSATKQPTALISSSGLNPFRESTTIVYTLPKGGPVRLTVHDVSGRQVALLSEGTETTGAHTASWDGRDASGTRVPGGVYFLHLVFDGRTEGRKVVLAR